MKVNTKFRFGYILFIIFLILGIAFGFMAFQTQEEYEEDISEAVKEYDYENLRETLNNSKPDKEPESVVQEPEEKEPSGITSYNPADMLAINKDFKGWLWIPGTYINYPVVQDETNTTYLDRSFYGNKSGYGCLFLDSRSPDGSLNRVIHGHNMGVNRSEMFSSLLNYQDVSWAEERTIAYFTEPGSMEDNQYKLFAVLNFNTKNLDTFNYFQSDFKTETDFQLFVAFLKDNSIYSTEYFPEQDIIILSTCYRINGDEDNRLLVCFGRTSFD